jgi:signal transduction histidine kinase
VEQQQVMRQEIQRLRRLTDNLRALSRLENAGAAAERQAVNLNAVIETVIMARTAEAEAKGLRLLYYAPPSTLRVFGNRDQLQQVLLNLVDNSLKFSDKVGSVVTLSLREVDGRARVRVSDEGIGIAPEDLPHVFDLAYRSPVASSARRRGSGVGLTLARRIVEAHGGTITLDSRPGAGTQVSVTLPLFAPDDGETS